MEGTAFNDRRREGLITKLRHVDGSPPYFVRWLDNGYVTLVFPGPDAWRPRSSAVPPARCSPSCDAVRLTCGNEPH